MTLVKFRPTRTSCATPARLENIFDSFFNDAWPGFGQEFGGWEPRVDIEETDEAIVLHADLPGLSKDDIGITVEDNTLTIRGERKRDARGESSGYHRVERSYGVFRRSFRLPANVLSEQVEAAYRDGVLQVTVPKAEEVKPRQIQIKG